MRMPQSPVFISFSRRWQTCPSYTEKFQHTKLNAENPVSYLNYGYASGTQLSHSWIQISNHITTALPGAISTPFTRHRVLDGSRLARIQLQNPILESHFYDHFQYQLSWVEFLGKQTPVGDLCVGGLLGHIFGINICNGVMEAGLSREIEL